MFWSFLVFSHGNLLKVMSWSNVKVIRSGQCYNTDTFLDIKLLKAGSSESISCAGFANCEIF